MPLAATADINATPLWNIVEKLPPLSLATLMAQASGAVEDYCNVRLAPFTNYTESCRAVALDTEESWDMYTPLDENSALAFSRAQSLGAGQLVRHTWLRQRPPTRPDLWQGSIQQIQILRAIAGSQVIGSDGIGQAVQYEPDTGHVRFYYGSFIPPGSTLIVTYSGGYNPIPSALVMATCMKAAILAITTFAPVAAKDIDLALMKQEYEELCSPYLLDGDG